ncbi:MAG TPA: sulfatase [Gaiellaceae bacterium]
MRRSILAGLLVAAALPLGAARSVAAPPSPAPHARRLNVVLILSDDERADGSAVMRNVHDLLALHGVTFSDYHVTTSECGPSRASILEGRYAHHTGVLGNFGPRNYPAFDQNSNLAVWLHDAGYQTALVGKYLNDYSVYGNHEIPPGWDDWQAMDSIPLERYYDYTLNQNGTLVHYGNATRDYSTTVLTQKATSFIRRAKQPFFLYFAPVAPHLPAIPAKQDQGKLVDLAPLNSPAIDEKDIGDKPWSAWHRDLLKAAAGLYVDHVRERQLESLYALDRSVKAIVDTLKQRGMLDRTVILYTSDNGFLWGEHRLGGKVWPYEDSTHVPLVVRTPWRAGNGTVNTEPVLNIDLASTISELAGVTPGLPQDGMSFVPFLHGRRVPWRKAFLVEYLGQSLLGQGGPPPYQAVHTRRYLYVEYRRGWRELYDLRKDPWELDNVASSPRYAAVRASLHRQLVRLANAPPRDVAA